MPIDLIVGFPTKDFNNKSRSPIYICGIQTPVYIKTYKKYNAFNDVLLHTFTSHLLALNVAQQVADGDIHVTSQV